MRANWKRAVTIWNTIPVKNGQNTPTKAALYSCKRFAAMPRIANR
jgi:hypothetical protein